MKLLMLSPYFYPERISSSHLTDDLYTAWGENGIQCETYAPTPTRGVTADVRKQYSRVKHETLFDGAVSLHRFSMFREGKNPLLRAFRYALVNLIQYCKGIRTKDIDAVYAASTPPTQGLLCGLVARRLSKKYGKKVPLVFALHDVFPDSLVNAGLTRKGSLIWRLGRRIEDFTYRHADVIIVISEDIRQNVIGKGVPAEKLRLIHNWIDTEAVTPVELSENALAQELDAKQEQFKVVYAGNLGLAQGVSVLVEAARLLRDDNNITFYLFGNGAEEQTLREEIAGAGLDNIRLLPLQPAERVSEVYSLGDACVVSCKVGTGRGAFPSKTVSIMATGRPLVAAFDRDSELCRLVEEHDVGLCTEPENAQALADAIRQLRDDRQRARQMGSNGRRLAEMEFGKTRCTQAYIELFRAYCGR